MIKSKIDYFALISSQVNSLDYGQLQCLFAIYFDLNLKSDFFMPEKTYKEFMNFFHETSSRNQPNTFKSLVNLLTTCYTPETKYPYVLTAIDMIKNNSDLDTIINVLYPNR